MVSHDEAGRRLKGETSMETKDFYQGFSDAEMEKYRAEVRERWGEKALNESEDRIKKMGPAKFAAVQAEGDNIFKAIAADMPKGAESKDVQSDVTMWRGWLEHFKHYPDEAVVGLGRAYSQDERFARYFEKYGKDFPAFLTKAIEYWVTHKK
jgi:MerR family transcriptional regulator, thiopeptide resistance regulator